jgi:hypothetical protein
VVATPAAPVTIQSRENGRNLDVPSTPPAAVATWLSRLSTRAAARPLSPFADLLGDDAISSSAPVTSLSSSSAGMR